MKGVLQRAGARRIARGFPDFQRSDTLRVLGDGRTYRVPDYTNLFVVTLPPNANRDSVVARLNRLPGVQYAEKNQRPAPRFSPGNRSHTVSSQPQSATDEVIPPNQEDFDKQWGLRNTSGPDIEATKAWTYTKGSNNVTIGIVDGGIKAGHVELSGKVSGYTGTTDHSTAVAGIAAAKGDNPAGRIAGVDWYAKIHSEPLGGLVNTAQSIEDAVTAGASVINNSWGFADQSTTLTQALRSAYEADVLLVHANPYKDGIPGQTSSYPNNVGPWIVNVGAMNQSGSPWDNTGSRSFTDVAAPGVDIYTSAASVDYYSFDGTSLAAPFVTGTASLLLSAEPSLHTHDIEYLLKRTAQSYGSGHDPEVGYGMIDAHAAVRRVSDPYEVSHGPASFTKLYNDDSVSFPNGFTSSGGVHYGAGIYICDIYKLSASASSPDFYYEEEPWFWLPVTEPGFSAANPNDGDRYLSKSVSKSSAEATTFFYYIETSVNGQEIGWIPFDPTVHKRGGRFQYTVIGSPGTPPLDVSLSGPTSLASGEQGTWTASVTGGSGSISYAWKASNPQSFSWYDLPCTTSSCSHAFFNDTNTVIPNGGIRVTVTRGGETDTQTRNISVLPSGPNCPDGGLVCYPTTGFLAAGARLQGLAVQAPAPGTATLRWAATGSLPAARFVIEHRADTTGAWQRLGVVPSADSAAVDTTHGPSYAFTARGLPAGPRQLRLRYRPAGKAPAAWTSAPQAVRVPLGTAYRLRAYPNPMHRQATVELTVRKAQRVQVHVYDVLGRRVQTLYRGRLAASTPLRLTLKGAHLASGLYFVRAVGAHVRATRRLSVVR